MAQNIFEDLVPRDVPKARKPAANAFADLIPEQAPQTVNKAGKGNMAPDDRLPTDLHSLAVQGLSLGFGDEIGAGITAPLVAAGNLIRGEGPANIGEAYDQQLAFTRDQMEAAREAHPYMAPAAEITGALVTGKVPAGMVLKGGNLVSKAARGAGIGAVYGGVAGTGAAEGGAESRLEGAKEGAALGGTVGAFVPPAAYGAKQIYRLTRAVTRGATAPIRSLANKETFAAQKVAEAAKRDQMSMPRLEARLRVAQDIKPDSMLADVGGKNMHSLLRSAGNVPSEAREGLTRGLAKRQDQQLNRLRGDIGAAFGDPRSFSDTVETLATTRKTNAKPLFDAAFATGTPWTVPLQNILQRPLMREFVARAERNAANRGEKFKAIFAQQLPNGKFKIARVPDTEALHRVKLEIDQAIRGIKNRTETSLGNVELRDLVRLKHEFMGTIQNPRYKRALDQFAGDSAAMNAIDDGFESGLTMEPEAITKALKGLSQTEADLWRMGFARKIVNQLRDSGRAGTNRAEILYSPKYLDRMRAAFKDSPTGSGFMRKLNLERQMFRTKNAAEGNSTTAAQLAEGMEAGVEAENIRQAADLGGKLMRGDVIGAMVNWMGRAKNMATGLRPEVADQIIRMLTSKDPAMVNRAQALVLKEMNKLANRQGRPQRVEQGVTTLGLGSIPNLALNGGL